MAGDVVIRYEFLPTEESIKKSAEKVVAQLDKLGGKSITLAAGKRLASEQDKTLKSIVDLLRAVQQKTSLQTKLLSGMKFFEPFIKKIKEWGAKAGFIGERPPAISATGIGQGEGGENIGQAAPATAGAGGGVMGALASIAGLLTVISIATTLIAAFFDAVGPILKVVLKMISAMILILLMPFLKRGLPILFGILKWMIEVAKGISAFADQFMTYIEKLVGKAMTGDPLAILELILGPMGMLGIFLIKKLVEFLAGVDWKKIIDSIVPIIQSAFEIVGNMIDSFAIAIFGEETWTAIKDAIVFIEQIFSPEGIWKTISDAIDYIGTEIFGEGVWTKIKEALSQVNNELLTQWNNIIYSLEDIGNRLKGLLSFLGLYKADTSIRSGMTSSTPLGSTLEYIKHANEQLINLKNSGFYTGAGGFGGGNAQPSYSTAGDFISRPGMGVQPFSSSDTIIGTKNPGAMGGVHITNNLTVSAGVDKNEFRKILAELNRQQARDLRTRTSYVGGVYA